MNTDGPNGATVALQASLFTDMNGPGYLNASGFGGEWCAAGQAYDAESNETAIASPLS